MRIRILVLLLVLSTLPSTMELVEAVVHWVEHGDAAHGDGHASVGMGADEHGCSGTFHVCRCHTANVITPAVAVVPCAISHVDREASFELRSRVGLGAMAPPIRPPIA